MESEVVETIIDLCEAVDVDGDGLLTFDEVWNVLRVMGGASSSDFAPLKAAASKFMDSKYGKVKYESFLLDWYAEPFEAAKYDVVP